MNKFSIPKILLFCFMCQLFSVTANADNKAKKATKIDFNQNWAFVKSNVERIVDFEKENKAMETVLLPHTWNAHDMVVGSNAPYEGVAWYRKTFATPSLTEKQRLLLEFEGVNNCHTVWINGGYAGGRNGGFLPTLLDITDLLEEGENTVLVRVDSRFTITAAMPANIDWNRYGGITRPVWMHVREHAYLTSVGVEIRTPEVTKESATTLVQVHVQEESLSGSELQIHHTLTRPNGTLVSTTSNSLLTKYSRKNTVETELPLVSNPKLWSDTNPILYTLKTEVIEDGVVIDQRTDRIGYRFFHFDVDKGFVLNGEPTQLRGANMHIFYPGLGNAVPERFHRSEMELMKKMGCNFMRTAHYPRPKMVLDICDELGILVMEEQPYWHGSVRASHGEEAVDNAPRLIQDMVKHHRNHPSIIAWNTVNEVMIAPFFQIGLGHFEPNDPRRAAWLINTKEYPYIRRHLQKMVDAFKEADPDRPVSMVVGGAWKKNDNAQMTSVAAMEHYTKELNKWLKDKPWVDIIGTWPLDGGGYCTCNECKVPETIVKAIKKLAINVKEEHPDVIVEYLCYKKLQAPTTAEDNMNILYCPNLELHPELEKGWLKAAKDAEGVCQFEYLMADHYRYKGHVWLRPETAIESANYIVENGFKGSVSLYLGLQVWWRGAFNYYFFGKAMWEENLEVKPILKEYCDLYYGNYSDKVYSIFDRILFQMQGDGYFEVTKGVRKDIELRSSKMVQSSQVLLKEVKLLQSEITDPTIVARVIMVAYYLESTNLYFKWVLDKSVENANNIFEFAKTHSDLNDGASVEDEYLKWMLFKVFPAVSNIQE